MKLWLVSEYDVMTAFFFNRDDAEMFMLDCLGRGATCEQVDLDEVLN